MATYRTEIEAATRHARTLPPERRQVFVKDMRTNVAFLTARLANIDIDDPVLDILLKPCDRVISESRTICAAFDVMDAFERSDFSGVRDGLNQLAKETYEYR
jgi:hypothetical protein